MEIIFLGTGGGRWVTITQRLRTGGFRIHAGRKIHIDPGPGALVSMKEARISPVDTDALIVTHCHPDHYNDAEILLEAMTQGMTKVRGVLAASETVLFGRDEVGPAISKYHRSKLAAVETLTPGKGFQVDEVRVEAIPTRHSDPTAVGLRFSTGEGVITYTSDTEYYGGLSDHYKGSRAIIFNVIRPAGERIPWHLCVDDVVKLVREAGPELAVLNHFGMKMVERRKTEALRVERETGVKTIAAMDGMVLTFAGGGVACESIRGGGKTFKQAQLDF